MCFPYSSGKFLYKAVSQHYFFSFKRSRISVRRTSSLLGAGGAGSAFGSSFFLFNFANKRIIADVSGFVNTFFKKSAKNYNCRKQGKLWQKRASFARVCVILKCFAKNCQNMLCKDGLRFYFLLSHLLYSCAR